MPDLFKSPASELSEPASGTFTMRAALLVLLALTLWMFLWDVQHWLAIQGNTLEKGARVSLLHFVYLKLAAVEIAWFRAGSSLVVIGLIGWMIRDLRYFGVYGWLILAYGITQLMYRALSISGVLVILSQVSGASLTDIQFWLSPAMRAGLMAMGLGFAWMLVPSVGFLLLFFIARSLSVQVQVRIVE